MPIRDGVHYVYEIVAGADVLYVGYSRNPKQRFAGHRATKRFPSDASMRIARRFGSISKAAEFEEARIKALRPPMNTFHADHHPTSRMRRKDVAPYEEAKAAWFSNENRDMTDAALVATIQGWTLNMVKHHFGSR